MKKIKFASLTKKKRNSGRKRNKSCVRWEAREKRNDSFGMSLYIYIVEKFSLNTLRS